MILDFLYFAALDIVSPEKIVAGGLILIAFIVFAECGLLFGFFFPGDTLLLLTGVIAAKGDLSLTAAILTIIISAILGAQAGYYIGQKYGPKVFKKQDGILFKQEYIQKSEDFYEKHGGKTIMFARFIPIVRTFAPVVAGVGKMNMRTFTFYNIAGAILWGASVTLIGYYFGSKIPNLDSYIFPIVIAVMILSFAPAIYHVLGNTESRQLILKKIKNMFNKSKSS